ncbi:hypothetical protein [Rhizocola hellebori]|nr:hypothetical protein [Rhizocola hellebori]
MVDTEILIGRELMNTRSTPFARHAGGAVRAAATLLLTLATMAGLLVVATPAQAAPAASVKPTRIAVPMVVKSSKGAAVAAAEPCGTLYITVTPEGPTLLQARLSYGFSVTIGSRVIYRDIFVLYSNADSNFQGSFTDNSFMFSFVYDNFRVVNTGVLPGTILATIGVTVTLTDFSVCVGIATDDLPYP